MARVTKDRKDQADMDPEKTPVVDFPPAPPLPGEASSEPATEVVAAPEAPPVAIPAVKAEPVSMAKPVSAYPKYKVIVHKVISWKGQIQPMHVGSVISDHTHGPGAVEQLKLLGVQMTPVPSDDAAE